MASDLEKVVALAQVRGYLREGPHGEVQVSPYSRLLDHLLAARANLLPGQLSLHPESDIMQQEHQEALRHLDAAWEAAYDVREGLGDHYAHITDALIKAHDQDIRSLPGRAAMRGHLTDAEAHVHAAMEGKGTIHPSLVRHFHLTAG